MISRCVNSAVFILVTLFPALALAGDAPATAPATGPSATLAEGKFHLAPPSSDTWETVKQPEGDILAYITKKHDAVMAIQLLPADMEINPAVTDAVVIQLREANGRKKLKMLLEPTVEPDERFALKVHERYEAGTKTADQMHLYRYVGKRLMLLTVNCVAEAADDVKAVQSVAEEVILSASGPGMKNIKRPTTRPGRGK